MTTGTRAITEDMLHAYADGLLDAADRVEVEAWLAEHPAQLAEVAAWQRQNEALNTLFGPVAMEPIPARLGPQLIAAAKAMGRSGYKDLNQQLLSGAGNDYQGRRGGSQHIPYRDPVDTDRYKTSKI